MTELTVITKGGARPEGKPRVYFTCHPADLERSLERLCGDLFAAADRARGHARITAAAEGELPEAVERLCRMYEEGDGVPLDYRKAVFWREKLAAFYRRMLGEEHPDTRTALGTWPWLIAAWGTTERRWSCRKRSGRCCAVRWGRNTRIPWRP